MSSKPSAVTVGDGEASELTPSNFWVPRDGDVARVMLVMVGVTHQHEIAQFGDAARGPRHDMMHLQTERVRASRHAAALVAQLDESAKPVGNGS